MMKTFTASTMSENSETIAHVERVRLSSSMQEWGAAKWDSYAYVQKHRKRHIMHADTAEGYIFARK
jgi:hypothetical protein